MTTSTETQDRPGFLKIWWVAIRPFALPASTMPVVFGTVLAVTIGEAEFDLFNFICALFGMAALHTGANLLNDVFDYKKGLDARVNPVSGAIVRGWISTRQATVAAALFFAVGIALGIRLVKVVTGYVVALGSMTAGAQSIADSARFAGFKEA